MKTVTPLLLALWCLASCTNASNQKDTETQDVSVADSAATVAEEDKIVYDYTALLGVYESTSQTAGYRAMLVIEPEGLELRYTLTTKNGDCTGTATGSIAMVSHAAYYHTGYSMEEKCKLEFILRHTERKIDVKEIHDCTLHGPLCAFEGTYTKVEAQVN